MVGTRLPELQKDGQEETLAHCNRAGGTTTLALDGGNAAQDWREIQIKSGWRKPPQVKQVRWAQRQRSHEASIKSVRGCWW